MVEAIEEAGTNCFVFRTSDNEFVQEELRNGRLRQGWSPEGTSFLDNNGQERTKEDWTQAYIEAWSEKPSPRRHGILRRMLDMRVGDVVLCPKAPADGQFTIAEVRKTYQFEVAGDQGDFGHIITVENQRVVSNSYNTDSVAISDLFRSAYFRSPIAKVQDDKKEAVLDAVRRLRSQGDTATPQDPARAREALYHAGRIVAARSLMGHAATWSFEQFEAAVGKAFERKGYERLEGNITRYGGDADHVFSMPAPGFEEIGSSSIPVLIVQVKHHLDGPTGTEGVNQLAEFQPGQDGEWDVRYRVLFSSADSFTNECRRLAEAHNVVLICGIEAGLFML